MSKKALSPHVLWALIYNVVLLVLTICIVLNDTASGQSVILIFSTTMATVAHGFILILVYLGSLFTSSKQGFGRFLKNLGAIIGINVFSYVIFALFILVMGTAAYLVPARTELHGRVAFSPDGKYIACGVSGKEGKKGIYRFNADWTQPTQLSNPGGRDSDKDPAFSPDGLQIAFVRDIYNEAFVHHLFIVSADGSGLTQLTSGNNLDEAPVFAANGRIYFSRRFLGGQTINWGKSSICSIQPDGLDLKSIPLPYDESGEPQISPDGQTLLFSPVRAVGEPSKFHFFSLEQQRETAAIEPAFKHLDSNKKWDVVLSSPIFTKDGKRIIFDASVWPLDSKGIQSGDASGALYRLDLDTGSTTMIVDAALFGRGWLSFSPNEERVIFSIDSSRTNLRRGLWSVKVDGVDLKQIQIPQEATTQNRGVTPS